jgi:hypothetical protein
VGDGRAGGWWRVSDRADSYPGLGNNEARPRRCRDWLKLLHLVAGRSGHLDLRADEGRAGADSRREPGVRTAALSPRWEGPESGPITPVAEKKGTRETSFVVRTSAVTSLQPLARD